MPLTAKELETEIAAIKQRNSRVEADKAWETSHFRIVCIAVLTYVIAAATLMVIHADNAIWAALIPAIGFVVSVQTFPQLKQYWIRHEYHKEAWQKK